MDLLVKTSRSRRFNDIFGENTGFGIYTKVLTSEIKQGSISLWTVMSKGKAGSENLKWGRAKWPKLTVTILKTSSHQNRVFTAAITLKLWLDLALTVSSFRETWKARAGFYQEGRLLGGQVLWTIFWQFYIVELQAAAALWSRQAMEL